jgi:hypothetical protein
MDGHPTGIQKLGIPLAFERRIGINGGQAATGIMAFTAFVAFCFL